MDDDEDDLVCEDTFCACCERLLLCHPGASITPAERKQRNQRNATIGVYCGVAALIWAPYLIGQLVLLPQWLFPSVSFWLISASCLLCALTTSMFYYLACSTDPGSPPREWKPANLQMQSLLSADAATNATKLPSVVGAEAHAAAVAATLAPAHDGAYASQLSPVSMHAAGTSQMPPTLNEDDPDALRGGLQPDAVRWCHACSTFKPARSYHCKRCRRCILRMDHHCPWIGQCVGYHNHGYFLRFLLSAVSSMSWGCLLIVCRVYGFVTLYRAAAPTDELSTSSNVLQGGACVIILVFMLPLTITVGMLMIWQFWLAAHNLTSIEMGHMEEAQLSAEYRRRARKMREERERAKQGGGGGEPARVFATKGEACCACDQTSRKMRKSLDKKSDARRDQNPWDIGTAANLTEVLFPRQAGGLTFARNPRWQPIENV